MKLDVLLTPAELPSLARRDLSGTICVVLDILRATSSFVTALQNDAKEIVPVAEISEAIAWKQKQPDVLLGGERNGVKIHTGEIEFDFGNSPREYMKERVSGKTIVSTTTNGTRAFRAVANAKIVLAGSFLNLSATAKFMEQQNCENILIVCAGTRERASLEDILAAGALCELLENNPAMEIPSDAAQVAFHAFTKVKLNLRQAVFNSQNARRVLDIPELRDDVTHCLQRDVYPLVALMDESGVIHRV